MRICKSLFLLPGLLVWIFLESFIAAANVAPQPALFVDINTTGGSNPQYLTVVGERLFFTADDGVHGYELWKSDAEGTSMVKDIAPPGKDYGAHSLKKYNGRVFFSANDDISGQELWVSDGTYEGTYLLKDIHPSGDSNPTRFSISNSLLFFQARDNAHGYELWKSDGTSEGTEMVKDINPGNVSSSPTIMTDVNGILYFSAVVEGDDYHLWKSDGTETGTARMLDKYGSIIPNPRDLTKAGELLFFRANFQSEGGVLWKSDGTEAGTEPLLSFDGSFVITPDNFTEMNGELYFSAVHMSLGSELWKSNGTPAGTRVVKDINPGSGHSIPSAFKVVNNTLYFSAVTPGIARELWKSDGTEGGTILVKDINLNPIAGSFPNELTDVNGILFFRANNGIHGVELWKSHGSASSTLMVKDILPGPESSSPTAMVVMEDRLYFVADDGVHGRELWSFSLQNQAPSTAAGGPYAGFKSAQVPLSGTFVDDDVPTLIEWTVNSPLCTFSNPGLFITNVSCTSSGVYTLTLSVRDWWDYQATDLTYLTITNRAPVIESLFLSPLPIRAASPVTAAIQYYDPDHNDTHTATIDWGLGTQENMEINQNLNTAAASHQYTNPGQYTITVRLIDSDGATAEYTEVIMVQEAVKPLYLPLIRR
jgi:ELWxxDGT repeat protein